MNLISHEIAAGAWSQLWQVTALIALVTLVVRLCCRRRPHLAYLLWMLVVIKCVTPPLWCSPTGVFSWMQANGVATTAAAAALKPTVQQQAGFPQEILLDESADDSALDAAALTPINPVSAWTVAAVVWLSGALLLSCIVLYKWIALHRRLKQATRPAGSELAATAMKLKERLGIRRTVRVLVTTDPLGPALVGFLRPVVVLPQTLLTNLSAGGVEPILAHELIHVRRWDAAVGLVQASVQILWWFHPLVWWANRQMSRERERCCDEEALTGLAFLPAFYARSLLDVLALKRQLRSEFAIPGIRPVEITSQRMEDIMQRSNGFHCRTPRWCWGVLLLAAALVLPGAGLTIEDQTQDGQAVDISTPTPQANVSEDAAANSIADGADSEEHSAGGNIVEDDQEAEEALKKNIRGFKIVRDEDGYVTSARTRGRAVTKEDLINISKLKWSKKRSTRIETDSWQAIPQPELRLVKAQLSDDDLVYLKDLTFLRKLDVGQNDDITDAGLKHLSKLTNLEVLVIHDTGITDAGLAHLKGMKKLSSIWMGGTDFADEGLAYLKNMKHLTALQVPGTSITDAGFEQFKDRKFREIDLSGTRITDKSLSHIGRMTDLRTLRLANTDVTESGLDNLVNLTNLKELDLSGLEVTDQWLKNLKNLENLWGLTLNYTKINGSGLKFLKHLPIGYLSIIANDIGDAAVQSLADFRHLEYLFVDNTKITGSGLEHLKDLTELMVISVSNAKITDEGLKHLHVFKEYRNPKSVLNQGKDLVFNLGGNGLSNDAIEELKAVLPHCVIAFW